jgi:hypothetical protein
METTKIYLASQQNLTAIRCPRCRKDTEVSIAALGFRYRLKVKCSCLNSFMVEVEFRDKNRKLVNLPGSYEVAENAGTLDKPSPALNRVESIFDRGEPNCRIIDLSRDGIGFLAMDQRAIKVGSIVELGFRLDDEARTEVREACLVKHVKSTFVGCKMLNENLNISFYLTGKRSRD